MHRGLAERSIVGVLWTASFMGAQAIFQVVALVVLARLLSPNEFGLFAATLVVTGFSSLPQPTPQHAHADRENKVVPCMLASASSKQLESDPD